MAAVKSAEKKQFAGLGQLILIASIVLFSPLVYFFINYMLGNENPYYGG